jgi:hypothetical protein
MTKFTNLKKKIQKVCSKYLLAGEGQNSSEISILVANTHICTFLEGLYTIGFIQLLQTVIIQQNANANARDETL